MAIYHLHAQIVGRSEGRSAVAAAAYRSGVVLYDEEAGKTFHWTRNDVAHAEIMAPEIAPEWVHDRDVLWNSVHALEGRNDSQLAREVEIALPRELSPDERLDVVRSYVSEMFVAEGMVADLAIHDDGTNHNPHAHVMLTLRQATAWGFKKSKTREWNSAATLTYWREQWAAYANRALERAGHAARIDHRTLEAQGIDRQPTIHEGPAARRIAAKSLTVPSSGVRRVRGWQRRGRTVVYDLFDQGRSRVAYNRQIELRRGRPNVRFSEDALDNRLVKDPQLDLVPFDSDDWRRHRAKLAEARRQVFVARAQIDRTEAYLRQVRKELLDLERRIRKLLPRLRRRYRKWLHDRHRFVRRLTHELVDHGTRLFIAEKRLRALVLKQAGIHRAETARCFVKHAKQRGYEAMVRQLALAEDKHLWRGHLPVAVKQQIVKRLHLSHRKTQTQSRTVAACGRARTVCE